MRRRDFTVNAMARRLATGELVDPLNGEQDLEQRVLRTVSPTSFAEDPLRLVRALRFVSQLDFDPDESTLRQMRDEAAAVKLVSGERIGGGLAADGMGELSKLLLGPQPAKALRLARDTGVLVELLPEFERRDRLRPGEPLPLAHGRRAHLRRRPGRGRRGLRAARAARGACSTISASRTSPGAGTDGRLHYYAKPGFSDRSHEQVGCELAREALLPAALSERAARPRRSDRALPHVPDRQGRRAARAAVPRQARRRARVPARRPQGRRLPRQARAGRPRAARRGSREARALPRSCCKPSGGSRTGSRISRSTAAT